MELRSLNQLIDLTLSMSNQCYALFGGGDLTSEYQRIINNLTVLKARLNKPELFILVSGEVKVGKSTFINCLIGKDVCPSADVVCTNVPSLIRYGENEKVFVHYKADDKESQFPIKEIDLSEIINYSTEEKNPRNNESVQYIEIIVNSPILEKGLVFIDTPGLGALDPRHAVVTFDMASQADMILFLGNTNKELSSFEIESLKQLMSCSKSGFIAHILTGCDQGDADIIRIANERSLNDNIPNERIQTICVSSKIYKKFVENHNDAYLIKSGYTEVFAFFDKIGDIQKTILKSICSRELLIRVEELYAKIIEIKEAAENPIKLESRLKELEGCKKRLTEIAENSIIWKQSFEAKQIKMHSEMMQFISDWQSKIGIEIDELVKKDDYLNNKEMLTSAIQSKLTVFKNDLECNLQSKMIDVYLGVRNETGFSKLQEDIHSPGLDIREVKLPDNCGDISKFNTIRNHFGSFMAGGIIAHGIGVTATAFSIGIPAASAKIGAIVGSIAPGLGTLIGTAGGFILGGLIALTISVFQSKDTKRKKMAGDCMKYVVDFFNNVRSKVSTSLTSNKLILATQFEQELKNQQKECILKIQKFQPVTVTARLHWDTIVDICKTLSKLSSELR